MKQKGFTLIELIIAVVIIGILTTVATVNYEKVRAKSRDSKRKKDIASIAMAIDAYYTVEKKYPDITQAYYYVDPDTNPPNWQPEISSALLPYLNPLPIETGPNFGDHYTIDNPCDYGTTRNYIYFPDPGGYLLAARLELYNDPDLITTAQIYCGNVTVRYGGSSKTLTGHPLFAISK